MLCNKYCMQGKACTITGLGGLFLRVVFQNNLVPDKEDPLQQYWKPTLKPPSAHF